MRIAIRAKAPKNKGLSVSAARSFQSSAHNKVRQCIHCRLLQSKLVLRAPQDAHLSAHYRQTHTRCNHQRHKRCFLKRTHPCSGCSYTPIGHSRFPAQKRLPGETLACTLFRSQHSFSHRSVSVYSMQAHASKMQPASKAQAPPLAFADLYNIAALASSC